MSTISRPHVESTFRHFLNLKIRAAVGLTQDPPPMCNDPDLSYFPIDGTSRIVHGDLASMIVGGLASLFLQMLHPRAMAGVAQHSRYQDDPLGRLLQTANFIGHTTYGSRATAALDIERVLSVHEAVRGTTDRGEPYEANEPHLLAWVHDCEASMFLDAYRMYGRERLDEGECNRYVNEMSRLASDLGAENPPLTYGEMWRQIEHFRPELELRHDGEVARDFLQRGFSSGFLQRLGHRVCVRASYDLLPEWARDELGITGWTKWRGLRARAAMRALVAAIHFFVPPTTRVA